MSFTIVNDNGSVFGRPDAANVLQIRATISTRTELEELIAKLTRRLETDFAQEDSNEHDTTARGPVCSGPVISAGSHTSSTGTHTQQAAQENSFNRAFRGD